MPPYKEEESSSPIGSGGDIETVELMKPEHSGLGLLIVETDDQPGVFIQEVVQNKAAYLDGRIRPGDRILAINGEKIYDTGQSSYYYRVKVICLYRPPMGSLGFSIVGGKGNVHSDLPIYIKQVGEGAARQDGRLKKGDQLLTVNGISFENVTHKFAAETLKHSQGDMKLEVISND